MKKYPIILVLLMLAVTLSAQTYKWTPDGTASGTVGGSGTWNNTDLLWWNGSTAVASNSGTLIGTGGATVTDITIGGSGTITKVGTTVLAGTGTSLTNQLRFGANGDFTLLGDGSGQSLIKSGHSKFYVTVAASSTLTVGGNGNYIGIGSGLLKPNDPTGFAFAGGGQVDFRSGAFLQITAGNGIASVRDEGRLFFHEGSMFSATDGDTSTPSTTGYAAFYVTKGYVEIDGGVMIAGYHMGATETHKAGIIVGAAASFSSTLTINSGTIKAIGNPSLSERGGAGILLGLATNNGGIANLNGGVVIVSNFRAQNSGTVFAHLNLNGATIMPTTEISQTGNVVTITDAMLQTRLDNFIGDDFNDITYRRVYIDVGGAIVDTSLIDITRTNGVASVQSPMQGIGDFTLKGPNGIRFAKVQEYTGATRVLEGTLLVDAVDAIKTSSTVYVAAGAILRATTAAGGTWRAQTLNNLSGGGLVQIGNSVSRETVLHNDAHSVFSGTIELTTAKLVKTGTGTLELARIPNISDAIATFTITEGAIRGEASMLAAALVTYPTTLINNSYLDFHQASGTQTISTSAMQGTGGIMKTGAGALEISALPSTLSNILIAEGALVANDVVLAAPIINNAKLSFNQAAGQTRTVVNHLISGTGIIEKSGDGTLELSSSPSSLTSIDVLSGTLRANAAGVATAINNSAYLEFFQAADTTSTRLGTVTGGGVLAKAGAGTVKLAASTSAAGGVIVQEGALLLINGATLTTPLFIAQANTTIGGHGSIIGAGTIQNATLRTGDFDNTTDSTALNITGDLTFSNSVLEFLLISGSQSTSFNYTGAALNSADLTINIIGAYSGTYNLGNIGNLENATLTVNGQAANVRQGGAIENVAGDLILKAANDCSRYVTWNNAAATGHWNVVDENWAGTNNTKTYAPGDTVIIDNATAAASIIIDSGVILSGLEIKTNQDLTLSGGGIITNTSFADGEITDATGKLIKTGSATLTLNSNIANNFTQGIDLAEGTLAFTHGNQLLSEAVAGITFTGGATLRPAVGNLAVATNITVPAGITATIESSSGTLTLAGKLNTAANSTLTKIGAGVLLVETTNDVTAHLGTTDVTQGTLALNAAFSSTATWKSPVVGVGAIEKTGPGTLILAAPLANTGATAISAGTLRLGGATLLNPLSAHTISAGATLDMSSFSQSMASLDNNGTINFTATINNTLGHIIDMQTLTVDGDVSGNGTLFVTMTDAAPGEIGGDPRRAILIVGGNNTADYTLALDRRYTSGAFDWQLVREGNSYVLGRDIPPEIPALGGVDAALTIGTQAAYASISQHLSANHITAYPDRMSESNLWLNTAYQRDDIDNSLYAGSSADTTLIQIGYTNYDQRNHAFALGFAVDNVITKMDMPEDKTSPSSTTRQYGFNAYLSRRSDIWYFDLHFRLTSATTSVEIPNTPKVKVNSFGYGASAEIGVNFLTESRWLIQPQAQFIYQTITTDSITDPFRRTYALRDTTTQDVRAGVMIAKTFVTKSKRAISPYIRGSYYENFADPTRITANADYTGPSAYDNDLSGAYILINGGVACRLSERFSISADFATYRGGPISRYAVNLGASLHW